MPMVFGLLSRLARIRVTMVYAVTLAIVTATLVTLGPDVQDRVIRHASTNLHNLNHGHVGTLLGSAFVVDASPFYVWLPGLVCLLAIGELLWCSGRLVIAFAVGHVGATLLVAAGLTAAVKLDWLPVAVARATDVGMSYGATAVLGSLTPAVPPRWRPTWIVWWLGVGLTVVAIDQDFTDVGHVVALVLGMAVATRFGRPRPWTPLRRALFAVASAFGYLILASSAVEMIFGTVAGLLVAALGLVVTLLRGATKAPVAPAVEGEPALRG